RRGGDLRLQAYYDRTTLDAVQIGETRDTFDVDFVHTVSLPGRQDFTWGLGARSSPSTFEQAVPSIDFVPRQQNNSVYSAFAQDELKLAKERLRLTLGAKLEHNNYTGFEILPSARAAWNV